MEAIETKFHFVHFPGDLRMTRSREYSSRLRRARRNSEGRGEQTLQIHKFTGSMSHYRIIQWPGGSVRRWRHDHRGAYRTHTGLPSHYMRYHSHCCVLVIGGGWRADSTEHWRAFYSCQPLMICLYSPHRTVCMRDTTLRGSWRHLQSALSRHVRDLSFSAFSSGRGVEIKRTTSGRHFRAMTMHI